MSRRQSTNRKAAKPAVRADSKTVLAVCPGITRRDVEDAAALLDAWRARDLPAARDLFAAMFARPDSRGVLTAAIWLASETIDILEVTKAGLGEGWRDFVGENFAGLLPDEVD